MEGDYLELRAENLCYRVGERQLLQNISLSVRSGEAIGLWGASGAGKTTLLLALRGVLQHYGIGCLQGRVLLDGSSVASHPYESLGAELALLFQDADMQVFSATVWDEIAFGLENFRWPVEKIHQRTAQVLEELGITPLAQVSPRELSGGQKKLVALAALLALRPRVLLLDEPLASLDASERGRILAVLEKLKQQGMALVLAGHAWEAAALVDHMFFLVEGKIAGDKPGKDIFSDGALLGRCRLMPPPFVAFLQAMGWPAEDFFHREKCWQRLKEAGYLA